MAARTVVRRPRGGADDSSSGRRDLRARATRRTGAEGKEQARQRVPRRGRPRGTSRTPGGAARRTQGGAGGAEREPRRAPRGKGAIVSITGEPGIENPPHRRGADAVWRAHPLPRGSRRLLCRDDPLLAGARAAPWLAMGVSDSEARVRLELRTELAHARRRGRRGLSLPRQPPRPRAQAGGAAESAISHATRSDARRSTGSTSSSAHSRENDRCAWCSRISTGRTRRRFRCSASCSRGSADPGRVPTRPSQ